MPAIQPVKGTRDFYPEDLAFRRWLHDHLREVSESYGYQEYDGPFLERLELYAAKSGEELVKEQSFVFPDRGGEMIALRPELTPSLARMVATRGQALSLPLRWWSFGPFWRYERPQKGRTREFYQWNIDLLGPESPEADAELAAIAAAFFRSVGLGPETLRLLVNDRRLAESQLQSIGLPTSSHKEVFRLIDRRDKMAPPAWAAFARESGLGAEQFSALQHLLDDREAWRSSPSLQAFFAAAEPLGAAPYLEYDPTVIRGLDYYTGTVFEARDRAGEHRAILGGGRYDNLVADVGGDPVPGVGFAMGDVVLSLVLKAHGALPTLFPSPTQVLVTSFDDAGILPSMRLAARLRDDGLRAEWYPQPGRLPRQMKYADRLGIPFVVILGPDELASASATLKDLRSGQQLRVPVDQLPSTILSRLATG
jgi:histidyl-tRNA synthetase